MYKYHVTYQFIKNNGIIGFGTCFSICTKIIDTEADIRELQDQILNERNLNDGMSYSMILISSWSLLKG